MDARIVFAPVADTTDKAAFHDVLEEAFGFPVFYRRNVAVWIDRMTSLDGPTDGLPSGTAGAGGVLALSVEATPEGQARCPERHDALTGCSAFVNCGAWR